MFQLVRVFFIQHESIIGLVPVLNQSCFPSSVPPTVGLVTPIPEEENFQKSLPAPAPRTSLETGVRPLTDLVGKKLHWNV